MSLALDNLLYLLLGIFLLSCFSLLPHVLFIGFAYMYTYLFIFSMCFFFFPVGFFLFFLFLFIFHLNLFVYFVYLFFHSCYLLSRFVKFFYCHGIIIFYLILSTWIWFLGFAYLDFCLEVSGYCLMCN